MVPTGVGKITDWIRSIGHVDDKLSQAKLLCPECLNVFQQHALPPRVGFDSKGKSPVIRSLNAMNYSQGDNVTVLPFYINSRFSFGMKEQQEIARIAPFLGGERLGTTEDSILHQTKNGDQ